MNEVNKICRVCSVEKPLSSFYKNANYKDGHLNDCIDCRSTYYKSYNLENADKNKGKYESNKTEIAQKARVFRANNKETISARKKKWNTDNPAYQKNYSTAYREKNKAALTKKNTLYKRNRKKNDPLFRLTINLRERTRFAFKSLSVSKEASTEKLLGVSFSIVKNHIERQFKKGMTWENYGQWEIDHVIPLSSANSKEELKTLCHYRNLQPLWEHENISKGAKIMNVQMQIAI